MKGSSDWREDFLKLIGKKEPSALAGTSHAPGAPCSRCQPRAASYAQVIYFPHFKRCQIFNALKNNIFFYLRQDTKQEAASWSSQAEGSWQPALGQEERKMKRRRAFVLSFTEDFIPSRYTTEASSLLEVGWQWPSCLPKLLLGHAQGKLFSHIHCQCLPAAPCALQTAVPAALGATAQPRLPFLCRAR